MYPLLLNCWNELRKRRVTDDDLQDMGVHDILDLHVM
jgi:hypothetical protein